MELKDTVELLEVYADNGYGLDLEIIATAFLFLKEHPEATVEEAIIAGHQEWIK